MSELICPFCSGRTLNSSFQRKDGLSVLHCNSCDLRFVSQHALTDLYGSIENLYDKKYFEDQSDMGYCNYDDTPVSNFLWQRAAIELIADVKHVRCLDVGCGTGKLMELLIEKGVETEGIELSDYAVKVALSKGLKIVGKDLLLLPDDSTFDIITAFDVIEHIPDIRKFIGKAYGLLKEDGVFIFLTPDAGSEKAQAEKERWYGYNSSLEHLYYFSQKSLGKIINEIFGNEPILYQASVSSGDGIFGFIRKKTADRDLLIKKLFLSNFSPEFINPQNVIPVCILMRTLGDKIFLKYAARYIAFISANADEKELFFLQSSIESREVKMDDIATRSKASVRLYQNGDEHGIIKLFKEIFGREMSLEEWRWKYTGKDFLKVYCSLAVNENNEVIAHYGGMPQYMVHRGKEIYGMAIGDVMVHPRYRGTKLFKKISELLPVISAQDGFILGYGFPNERAMKLPEKLGIYEKVEDVYESSKEVRFASNHLRFIYKLFPLSYDDNRIDILWGTLKDSIKISLIRDRKYLRWRYREHPLFSYELCGIKKRWQKELTGFVVLRRDGENLLLIDFLYPPQALPAVLQKTENYAASSGCKKLKLWHPGYLNEKLQQLGFNVSKSGTCIPRSTHPEWLTKQDVEGKFFYTMGDTDFM